MENNLAPFYVGQKVVGSEYAGQVRGRIKKGQPYTIASCHLSINPANGTGPYWYVGAAEDPQGMDGNGRGWISPKLFSPIQENPIMTFDEIKQNEKSEVLLLN